MSPSINSQLGKPRRDGESPDNIYSVEESSESDQLSESSNFTRNDTHTNGNEGDNQSVQPELRPSLLYR